MMPVQRTHVSCPVYSEKVQPFTSPIAFSVGLTFHMCNTATKIVPYDHVIRNHGGGYDQSTYQFVAPVRGLYSFTVSLLSCFDKN